MSAAPNQDGAVLVLVAIVLPVLILLASFVIDAGNWFQHQAHLQLQADAGALAGSQEFSALACQDTPIVARARQYSGIAGGNAPLYNRLTGNVTSLSEAINSQTYPTQAGTQPAPDPTPMTGSPCTDKLLDVKISETSLPWYFKAIGAGGITAHARVSIVQQTSGSGFLPVAVNEQTPVAIRAYFVNEDVTPGGAGWVLATSVLSDQGKNAAGQEVWSSPAPVGVAVSSAHLGVVVALSGTSSNTTCPPTSQFVSCFDTNPGPSLVHIQGYPTTGTGTVTAPIARSVTLAAGGATPCTDGYFSNPTSNCTVTVTANVDLGANKTGVSVTAGVGGNNYPLTLSGGSWTGTATVPTAGGSNQVDLTIACDATVTGSPCFTGKKKDSTSTTRSDVQRSYTATPNDSGTIQAATVWQNSISNPDADSFATGSTPNLGVTITVAGSLGDAQSVSDPLYVMRFGSGTSASQTGAVDCPPGGQGQYVVSLEQGCNGLYSCNGAVSATECPAGPNDPSCVNTNPTAGMNPPPPADCVLTKNGLATGQLRTGMNTRLAAATSPCVNNWSSYPNIPQNDPRVVQVFVTAYGSFGQSGLTPFPIQTFASFYVMGWDGDPCLSGLAPTDTYPPGENAGSAKDQIWGHFIKYIDYKNPNGGGNTPCIFGSLGDCVPVLTR